MIETYLNTITRIYDFVVAMNAFYAVKQSAEQHEQ